jgi:hypothetical protein
VSKPVRLTPLDLLRYQKIPPGEQSFDLLVNNGLPIQLFDREDPKELHSKFRVLEAPEIEYGWWWPFNSNPSANKRIILGLINPSI